MAEQVDKKKLIYEKVLSGEIDPSKLSGLQKSAVEKIMAEYSQKGTSATGELYGVEPIQEMHPDISMIDRAAVKNLGTDTDESIVYLKQQYGDKLDFDKVQGQIVAKRPDEKEWRVLDPEYFGKGGFIEGAKEAIRDVTDVAYDIPAGMLQGAATTAGGLAGLPLGPGGALAAGAAAGAGSGLVAEGIRQGLGNLVGVSSGLDKTSLALSGALGGVGPLAFGVGTAKGAAKELVESGAKQVAKTGVLRQALGMTTAEAKKALESGIGSLSPSQKKLLTDYVSDRTEGLMSQPAKKALGFLSGFSAKAINTAQKPISPILRKQLERLNIPLEDGVPYTMQEVADILNKRNDADAVAKMAIQAISDEIKRARRTIGAKMNLARETAEGAGVEIDIYDAAKPIRDYIEELADLQAKDWSPERAKRIQQAQSVIDDFLSTRVPSPDDPSKFFNVPVTKLGPEATFDRQQAIKDKFLQNAYGDKYEDALGKISNELESKITQTESNIRNQLKKKIGAQDVYKEYAENEEMTQALYSSFKDLKRAGRTIGNIESKANAGLRKQLIQFDDKYGGNTMELAELMQTWRNFTESGVNSIAGRGSEVAQRAKAIGVAMGGATAGAAKLVGVPSETAAMLGLGVGSVAPTTIQYMTTPQKIAGYTSLGTKIDRAMDAVKEPTQAAINKLGSALPKPIQKPYELGVRGLQGTLRPNMLPSSAWLLLNERGEDR